MNNRRRYTLNDIQRSTFYQMPKFLFEDEFEVLSNDARVLYSLLRDRHELSVKNKWINENGEVYLIFSRESMCSILKRSDKTVTKAMNDLKQHKLIDEQRQGLGKPNLIYLLSLESLDFTKNRKFYDSVSGKITVQSPEKFRPNDTDKNEINKSEIESQSQSQTAKPQEPKPDLTLTLTVDSEASTKEEIPEKKELSLAPTPTSKGSKESISTDDDYIVYKEILQDNINYSDFLISHGTEIDLVDELIDCMLDVICTHEPTVRINGEQKSRNLVKSQYLKVNYSDIEHVLYRYKTQRHKITHVHAYLKTMLYTCKQENGHHYTNAVRADGVV